MSEIPEGIIKRATEFQAMVDADPQAYVAFDVAVLAMMSERQRCAKIAEDMDSGEPGDRCWRNPGNGELTALHSKCDELDSIYGNPLPERAYAINTTYYGATAFEVRQPTGDESDIERG